MLSNRNRLLMHAWNQESLHMASLFLLRGYVTLKYGDVHEKFNLLEIQDLRPLRACQKHFETILPNFLPDECEI